MMDGLGGGSREAFEASEDLRGKGMWNEWMRGHLEGKEWSSGGMVAVEEWNVEQTATQPPTQTQRYTPINPGANLVSDN